MSKSDFHLNSHFSHHDCRLCFVLVCLNLSFIFFGMVICLLISLSKSVVICLTCSVVSKSTKVGFWSLLLLNFNSHTFYLNKLVNLTTYLVILHPDLDFEVGGHHELVSFNRVEVVLLLVFVGVTILLHLLHLKLIHVFLLLQHLSLLFSHHFFFHLFLLHLVRFHLLLVHIFHPFVLMTVVHRRLLKVLLAHF